jgi:DNA-directed RNA polymerase I subunit RPA1
MKQIARLTLLEHGLVTAALNLDSAFQAPASTSKKAAAAKAKAAAASDHVEDADVGESVEETTEELSTRLEEFVQSCLRAAKKGKQAHAGRDEYKESGTVFDVRRKVIAQFIKSLSVKRRCEHCGAYVPLPFLWFP